MYAYLSVEFNDANEYPECLKSIGSIGVEEFHCNCWMGVCVGLGSLLEIKDVKSRYVQDLRGLVSRLDLMSILCGNRLAGAIDCKKVYTFY